MSITPGNWTPFTFSVTPAAAWNALTAAQANTAVTAIRDAFVAAAGSNGWSADGAAVEYVTGTNTNTAVISAQHTSGDRILFVVKGTGSAMSALNSDVGSNISNGAVGLAYNAGGAFSLAANTTNISTSALFTDANQNRFSSVFESNGSTVSYAFYGAVQGRNVWITGQNSTASASQWSAAVIVGHDIIGQLVHSGDTSTQAQIRFGGLSPTASNHGDTALTLGVAQVRAADGTTRRAARIFCVPLSAAAVQNVTSTSWVLNDIWVARDAGDISTTGIIANNGVKGRVDRGAAMLGPQAITNKVRVGPAQSMLVHTNNGLCLGWDENAAAGIP
jgi:hypothetical protein